MKNTDIFVFGSNTEGKHGAGAALYAKNMHNAIYGVPMGLQGNAYGIITKDLRVGERSVSLDFIQAQVTILLYFAIERPELTFYVTRIGCGHAGFTEEEIAPMFQKVLDLGIVNVKLCLEFYDRLNKSMNFRADSSKYLWKNHVS